MFSGFSFVFFLYFRSYPCLKRNKKKKLISKQKKIIVYSRLLVFCHQTFLKFLLPTLLSLLFRIINFSPPKVRSDHKEIIKY